MNSESTLKIVPTRAALLMKNKTDFVATVFEEPTPNFTRNSEQTSQLKGTRKREHGQFELTNDPKKKDDLEFDIKKARHEVINFALTGVQSKNNKKKMQIVQAVKLGAKAPKKVYKNYKDLLDEKKRLKNIREERQKFHQLGKNQTGAASVRCSKRKSVAAAKQKKKVSINNIARSYGIVNPKLKKK